MSGDMTAWLRAEFDRREQTARRAQGEWKGVADGWRIRIVDEQGRTVAHLPTRLTADDSEGDYATATLIEEHDPASVLRRIAADRKLLAEHADDGYGECKTCSVPDGTVEVNGMEYEMLAHSPAPCATVRLLAEGYGWTGKEQT